MEIASFILFADDTNVFVCDKSFDGAIVKINQILRKMKLYLEANYLHVNLIKTKFIHFQTPRQIGMEKYNYKIYFGNDKIKKTDNIKFLGVTINESLSWIKHIQFVTNKVRNSIAQLYEMRKLVPKTMKKVFIMQLLIRIFLMQYQFGAGLLRVINSIRYSYYRNVP